ncbi:hypothetical protein IWW48_000668 [Coemansia sp. RSA 1200]|nr:hypothetical protein IWW48_000668 [Coemansia sp. RSA 1200]
MDAFTNSVGSHIIYLDGYEVRRSPFHVAIGYWYKNDNPDSSDEFMPPKLLQDAFYRALQDFPILAGHIKTDNYSRVYVDVNKDNLNMPVYTDTTCDLNYSDMEKIGFNVTKVPIDLYGTYGVPVPSKLSDGKIKSANIRILRFKNNSGVLVYASIGHSITDGYGYVHFMNRWAEVARSMLQQRSDKGDNNVPLPVREYVHDRSVPNGLRSNKTTALSASTVKYLLNSSNSISRWIAWLSPEKRGWLIKKWIEKKDHTCCFFHIPSKRIEDLRNSVQKYAPTNVKYSINDILVTYLGIVVAQAKQEAKADKGSKSYAVAINKLFGRSAKTLTEFDISININMRSRVDHSDANNYMGNMIIRKEIGFPYDLIQKGSTGEVLATLAQKIRKLAAEPHSDFYAQKGFLLDIRPDNIVYKTFFDQGSEEGLVTSNLTRFAHYGVDFGSGAPAIVRHAPPTFDTHAYIMPTNPKLGGYEIELKLAPDEMEAVIQNTNWMKLVDSYEHYL